MAMARFAGVPPIPNEILPLLVKWAGATKGSNSLPELLRSLFGARKRAARTLKTHLPIRRAIKKAEAKALARKRDAGSIASMDTPEFSLDDVEPKLIPLLSMLMQDPGGTLQGMSPMAKASMNLQAQRARELANAPRNVIRDLMTMVHGRGIKEGRITYGGDGNEPLWKGL